MAGRQFSEMRDLVKLDMYAQSFVWKHPELETVILRPVNIVGPTVRNAPRTSSGSSGRSQSWGSTRCSRSSTSRTSAARSRSRSAGPARRLQRDGSGAAPALRHPARARTAPHPRAAPPHPVAPAPRVRAAHELPAGGGRSHPVPLHRGRVPVRPRGGLEPRGVPPGDHPQRGVAVARGTMGVPCARPRSCSSPPRSRRPQPSQESPFEPTGEIVSTPRPAWAAEPRSTRRIVGPAVNLRDVRTAARRGTSPART